VTGQIPSLDGECHVLPYSLELNPAERGLREGYAEWAESYNGPNPMIETEQAVVRPSSRRSPDPERLHSMRRHLADPHPTGGVLGGQAFYGGVGNGRTMTFVRSHPAYRLNLAESIPNGRPRGR
jgi:hypothetical protein